jgi:predicted membrane-bound spermidine synthase
VKKASYYLYFLSFLEGASVMVAELIGAKMLAPYYGSSLYVWATVMAVTLGGLALGYFCGGIVSYRNKSKMVLPFVLLTAACFIILMPFSSRLAFALLGMRALIPAVIASSIVFLFPPVFMMGMVSPLIISRLTSDAASAGKAAGAVYAISTLGGILATFMTGFWIIPHFGLSRPCMISGMLLGLSVLPALLKNNKGVAVFFIALSGYSFVKANTIPSIPGVSIVYFSEGLLGQIMVADYPNRDGAGKPMPGVYRLLFVNRIIQSAADNNADTARRYTYVDQILKNLRDPQNDNSVLVCGLGGASLVEGLSDAGLKAEACELDPRIAYVARTFFKLNPAIPVYTDDARHFLRLCKKKYGTVVLDLFKGEENPGHCFTKEAFLEIKKLLPASGLLVVNCNGFYKGEAGAGTRAVYNTLVEAGYRVEVRATAGLEAMSNLIFYATLPETPLREFSGIPVPQSVLQSSSDLVLTDDRPVLDVLNAGVYQAWRKSMIHYFDDEGQKGRVFPVFY